MAKLTLSFKDRKLKVFALRTEEILIGRKPDCTISIDSLAIEPHHARVRRVGKEFVVEPVDENTRVLVNDQPVSELHTLQEGDLIQIGKHSLVFSGEGEVPVPEAEAAPSSTMGWLQIQSGNHLGRTIRLDKAFTRIGKPDAHLAVIAHRDDGYYLSHLHGKETPQVNEQDIGEEARKLNNNDRITIGSLQVLFYVDSDTLADSGDPAPEHPNQQQRRFSRIPFNVRATLRSGEKSWETDLIDISLHGALLRLPEDFEAETGQNHQLQVHLEGGPDICMEVSIAHREGQEIGLRCADIDVDSITHLRRLVELNLGDPELLERELSALG